MKKQTTAFTLIELLVVIVIIGILATVSTATFGGASSKALIAKYGAERIQAAKERYEECLSVRSESECFPKTIAWIQHASGLYIKSPDENNLGIVIEDLTLQASYTPSFSPDGRYIIYDGDKGGYRLYKKDVLTNTPAIAVTSQRSSSPIYSLDGKYIYYSTSSGDIYRKDADDNTTDNGTLINNVPGIYILSISPDGRSLLYTGSCEGSSNVMCSMNIGGGDQKSLTTTVVTGAVYSPDGEYIIYTNGSDNFRLYKKDATTLSNGSAITNQRSFSPKISADMKDIYYYTNVGTTGLYKKSFDDNSTANGSRVSTGVGQLTLFPW